MTPSRTRSVSARGYDARCAASPVIRAEALHAVREPGGWPELPGPWRPPADLAGTFAAAVCGCRDASAFTPPWLFPWQRHGVRRIVAALDVFGGAMLADAVGLGKTWMALAVARRAKKAVAVVPAVLAEQWHETARRTGVPLTTVSHETLSRGRRLPPGDLVIVDEAHRFRNPRTRRYDRLARDLGNRPVLLITATPVVNRSADLVHLLRLFLPDHGLATLGIPSLEDGAAAGSLPAFLHAAAPLVIARTADTVGVAHRLPTVVDAPVSRRPTVERRVLECLVTGIDGLRFPAFGPDARALLHQHLLYRLASSRAAFLETVQHHVRYCRRAARAAARGETLTRRAARAFIDPELDGQLELALGTIGSPALDGRHLEAEAARLGLLSTAACGARADPKSHHLRRRLAARSGPALVFTAARATALSLARDLGWRRVGVVTGRGGRIASGPVSAEKILDLFAPRGRRRRPPPAGLGLDVLLATDLASEGLNLQDAATVVHYDVPWSPLRLLQRTGRTARLESPHRAVDVWWFLPPPLIERRLALRRRIAEKARAQLRLAVPVSGRVGRAAVASASLTARETLLRDAPPNVTPGWTRADTGVMLVAVCWTRAGRRVRQLIGLTPAGSPCGWDRLLDATARLAERPGMTRRMTRTERNRLFRLLRRRVADGSAGSRGTLDRDLARRVLRRARAAGARRDAAALAVLDDVLARLRAGLRVGEARELRAALDAGDRALGEWARTTPLRSAGWGLPVIEAVALPMTSSGRMTP